MAGPDTLFTGPLEHRHLAHLIPLADVTVVPSIFPEAFGMVAAEAAAGGSLPLVARHSGLAEIADALEAAGVPAGFESGSVDDLAEKLESLLRLAPAERAELSARARRVTEERWSWASVSDRLLQPFA
jgi:glycosyltransferase involved in cell wall biosynthesis